MFEINKTPEEKNDYFYFVCCFDGFLWTIFYWNSVYGLDIFKLKVLFYM